MYKAICTWGDGPDVLLIRVNDAGNTTYDDLTAQQALNLAAELTQAASTAIQLDKDLETYIAAEDAREAGANQAT